MQKELHITKSQQNNSVFERQLKETRRKLKYLYVPVLYTVIIQQVKCAKTKWFARIRLITTKLSDSSLSKKNPWRVSYPSSKIKRP